MLGAGYDWRIGALTLGPTAPVQYTYVSIDGFTERGANSLNLRLHSQEADSLRTTLGGRIAYSLRLDENIILTPELRASWQHEYLQGSRTLQAAFGGDSSFGFRTASQTGSSFLGSATLNLQLPHFWCVNLGYYLNAGRNNSHMVTGGVNLSF